MDKDNNFSANTSGAIAPAFDLEGLADDSAGVTIADIKSEAAKVVKVDPTSAIGLFIVRTANACIQDAKSRPIPKQLFGVFWFEGELCVLYADTNLGKSILAVQIADAISKGLPILGFKAAAKAQAVLYLDCELNDKQFESRYSEDYCGHYSFSDNLKRAEIYPESELPDSYKGDYETFLHDSLERAIIETGAKVVIVDNITYLSHETEKAKDALPLMKQLKRLKAKHGLSILCLAHTPKRDLSKPITRNDLQGSKMIINFCDSSFAIGESHNDKSARYLKQIKSRNTEIVYDTENVMLCQISKPTNFLQFDFLGYAQEREHLRVHTQEDRTDIVKKVKEMNKPGVTQRQIAEAFGISLGAVNKYLNMDDKKEEKKD